MTRNTSEATPRDIAFIKARNVVADYIKGKDLKEFIKYLEYYVPKKGKKV